MSKTLRDPLNVKRAAAVFSCLLSWSAILFWAFLIVRNSFYLQEGYYFFNGPTLVSLILFLTIPIFALVYWNWEDWKVHIILLFLQSGIAIITFVLIWNYLSLVEVTAEPPFILLGLFLQNSIVFIALHNALSICIFLVNLLLLVMPAKITTADKKIITTIGLGLAQSNLKQYLMIVISLAGGFIVNVGIVYLANYYGIILWLIVLYIGTVLCGISMWWVSRGVFYIELEDIASSNPQDVRMKRIYSIVSLLIAGITLIALIMINSLGTYPFLMIAIGILFILIISKWAVNRGYVPKRISDKEGRIYYFALRRDLTTDAGFIFFGGIIIFLGAFLYNINVDVNTEFLSLIPLLTMISIGFIAGYKVISITTPKVLMIMALICLCTSVFLNLKVADFAMSDAAFWNNRLNVIVGLPFHQTIESAFLSGVPIGLIFAIFIYHFSNSVKEPHHASIIFEASMIYYIFFLISGLLFSHDIKYDGLHSAEQMKFATVNYETFTWIFIGLLIITAITVIISLISAYYHLKPKPKPEKEAAN